jgi:hypothetical protein
MISWVRPQRSERVEQNTPIFRKADVKRGRPSEATGSVVQKLAWITFPNIKHQRHSVIPDRITLWKRDANLLESRAEEMSAGGIWWLSFEAGIHAWYSAEQGQKTAATA